MASDGVFRYRDGIAVAQIIAFALPLLSAIYFRHIRQIGWFCIGVFALLRIVGASCKLATINSDSDGLYAAVFVCESLGMLLIIFLLLEMLERINKVVTVVRKRIFLIPSLLTWVDIGMSIAGWVAVMHVADPLAPTPYSQASMALLTVIYFYLVGAYALFWHRRAEYSEEEQWALRAVTICIPVLAVRLAYSLIFIISGNMKFSAIKGDATAYLIMTMLPEVVIIVVCTSVIAFKITPLQQGQQGRKLLVDEENQSAHSMTA